MSRLRILGISGSLRRASTNTGLLRAAATLVPPETELEVLTLHGIPPFNEDDERLVADPVRAFKEKVRRADALLFAVAEYNFGPSGVLKNAIDWGSRPPEDNVWPHKPVAMMSASSGTVGGVRAQHQLRQWLVSFDMYPLQKPEVLVTFNARKFDANGDLTDAEVRPRIAELLAQLVRWTLLLRQGSGMEP